jgi:hypothetical protein
MTGDRTGTTSTDTTGATSAATAADAVDRAHATEADNAMVWKRGAGHYEVWYLTVNHRPSETGFWIRYTLEAPNAGGHEPWTEVWFACFDAHDPRRNFAFHRRHPIGELRATASPFQIAVGDACLRHDAARGSLAGAGHEARWDLSWRPAPRTHHHLPAVIYRTSFADTRVLSPNLDVPITGTIVVDGRELRLGDEPGGQTHLWGRKHAHAWGWGHCNAFAERAGAALETLSARLARGGLVLPPLTLATLYLDGEELRFTELSHTLFARTRLGSCRYRFLARGAAAKLEGEFACRPEDMVVAEYLDPDGEAVFCANSCVADLRLTVWRRSRLWNRWREAARLSAPRSAHFEVAARAPDPAVEKRHQLIP